MSTSTNGRTAASIAARQERIAIATSRWYNLEAQQAVQRTRLASQHQAYEHAPITEQDWDAAFLRGMQMPTLSLTR